MKAISMCAIGVVGLVLVAGATGSARRPMTKTAYVTQLKTIGKNASASIAKLESVRTAGGAASLLAEMRVALKRDVTQLRAITPPTKIAAVNRQLVRALNELVVELNPIITKFKAHEALQAITSIYTLKGLRDLETTGAALRRAGFGIQLGFKS